MSDYSLEALGQVVKRLRLAKGLTQEELGDAAKYGKGAGVSISRLENGRLEPTDKFTGIARALGVSTQELRKLATEETAAQQHAGGDGAQTHEDRIAAILRASERRKQLAPELDAFNDARKKAERDFLMKFRELAAHVIDAPAQDENQLLHAGGTATDEAQVEAAYQIRFTQYGVSKALTDPAGSAALGGAASSAAAYLAFAEAVALGTAPLGKVVPLLPEAATALNGLRAAMGVGRSARIGSKAGGINLVAAVAVGAAVAAIVDRQATAKRNRRQQESAAKIAAAEADVATNQANVEALLDVIPRATKLLDYIALHASHALTRWGVQIGQDPVTWEELGETEQQRYQDFVAVAAAQLGVATIDFQELATSREADFDQATALADQVLIQAQRAITSRV